MSVINNEVNKFSNNTSNTILFNYRKRKSSFFLQPSYSLNSSTFCNDLSDNNDSIAARLKRRRLSDKEYLKKQQRSSIFIEERRVERLWRELKKKLVFIYFIYKKL